MSDRSVDEDLVDFEFEVSAAEAGSRLDVLITKLLKELADTGEGTLPKTDVVPSRSKVARWIEQGFVRVNYQQWSKASAAPPAGALISVSVPPAVGLSIEPDASVPVPIVYEDDDLLVLDKPAGMVVHPGAGQYTKTLVHGLLAHLGEGLRMVGDALRPGLVHRLDKDTSGLMVVAKNDLSYRRLAEQFVPPRTISRSYLALTLRLPRGARSGVELPEGEICEPLGRHPQERTKMAVVTSGGRPAHTRWRARRAFPCGFELEITLETGRTHQIRVHLAHYGAPIVGDTVYGPAPGAYPPQLRGAVRRLNRQALHAAALSFMHPRTGQIASFTSPLPPDMQAVIEAMAQQ